MKEVTFLIIGGGVAGVSCAQGLNFLAPEESSLLISASPTIKNATNLVPLSKMLMQFDVEETSVETLTSSCPSVSVLHDSVSKIDCENHLVVTVSGEEIHFKKLCICSGASPKLIDANNPFIVGIRDTDSVCEFQKRVSSSRRIMVVGNGGIATEIVHEINGVEIVWVIKDEHISATFIDPGAAKFFHSRLKRDKSSEPQVSVKRHKFTVSAGAPVGCGAALGPDWHSNVNLQGLLEKDFKVTVEYQSEVETILSPERAGDSDWPVYVRLTNGKMYGCDLIVSATGVSPNVELVRGSGLELAEDGGIKVNWNMETNVPDVFAAGDVCSVSWERAPQWFQMRLWTQARQMGLYAAKTMHASLVQQPILQDFCFELFTHVTRFFGMKVILLGLFNGQTLGSDYELLLRITNDVEYVKLVLKDGKLQGAVLIGETDLEEMCENLILNQLDLTPFGEDLLNPNIDIEDYFD